jgi:hypothetical protein
MGMGQLAGGFTAPAFRSAHGNAQRTFPHEQAHGRKADIVVGEYANRLAEPPSNAALKSPLKRWMPSPGEGFSLKASSAACTTCSATKRKAPDCQNPLRFRRREPRKPAPAAATGRGKTAPRRTLRAVRSRMYFAARRAAVRPTPAKMPARLLRSELYINSRKGENSASSMSSRGGSKNSRAGTARRHKRRARSFTGPVLGVGRMTVALCRRVPDPTLGPNLPGCKHPAADAARVGLRPRTLIFRKPPALGRRFAVCEAMGGQRHSNLLEPGKSAERLQRRLRLG